jgi:hypothetical protein
MVTTRSSVKANVKANTIVAQTQPKSGSKSNVANASDKSKNKNEETVERRITRSCSQKQQHQQEQTTKSKINSNSSNSNSNSKSKSKNGEQAVKETVQEKSPEKMTRDERRRNEAFLELKTLGKVSSLIVSGQRRRKQADHQDAAFVLASFKQSNDAGRNGGLVKGSRHHYDRSY